MDPGEHAERKKPEENKENEHSVEVSAHSSFAYIYAIVLW